MKSFCPWVLALTSLAGCNHFSNTPPTCSDDKTLDLVREIVSRHALGAAQTPARDTLRQHLIFSYPHATKLEENIRKFSCEAELAVTGGPESHKLHLTYESQLDDAGDHLVQVGNLGILDDAAIRIALSPVAPVAQDAPAVVTPATVAAAPVTEPVPEPAATPDGATDAEPPPPTPEQLAANKAARQAVLDGHGLSGRYPRFADYQVDALYDGPTARLDMRGDTAKTFRTRLREALADGEIMAGGEYTGVGWGCGAGCMYSTFVNKRTGQAVEEGIGGEAGERIVDLDPRSRLVISEGPEMDDNFNELGYYAFFYELADNKLTLLKKIPIARSLEE